MKKAINQLVKKYEKAYHGAPWYGDSIKKILNGTDPKIVFQKADKKAHSIAELTIHMIGWREFVLSRLEGNDNFKVNQKETFNWKRIDKNEKTAWKSILNELDKNQRKIISTLGKKNDEFLDEPVAGRKYKMKFLIDGIIQHDIYHLGQIAMLNKLLR